MDETILNWFKFHPATFETAPVHNKIRETFRNVAAGLLEVLPNGPDKTLALRKLQDAMMSANACVANAQTEDAPQRNPNWRYGPS